MLSEKADRHETALFIHTANQKKTINIVGFSQTNAGVPSDLHGDGCNMPSKNG